MRVAVFSDVHGNLSALEAVLKSIDEQDKAVDVVVFAGDLCLFGPRPAACVDLLRQYDDQIACLYGNTDSWIDGPPLLSEDIEEEERRRRQHVDDVISWTHERLEPEHRAWLREWPFHRRISPTVNPSHDLFIVHANPKDTDRIIFPPEDRQEELFGEVRQTDGDLETLLDDLDTGILAFGHLHVPFVREWRDKRLVNVSSVSVPGDGDHRAKYALFNWDGTTWNITHVYVDYDVAPEIAAFRANRPPGWEDSAAELEAEGMISQSV